MILKPSLLWLEVTNRCNGNCIYCGRQYVGELHDMDFNLYKKIVDSCPSAETVQVSGFGEPLLYPHLVEAVAYARKKKKKVRFYTNASLLTEDLSVQLLRAGLSEIRFSVDNYTKKGYESLRPGLKWEDVLTNIVRFEHLKRRGGYKTATLLRMTRTKENHNHIPKIVEFWERIVPRTAITSEVYIPPPNMLREKPFSSEKPINCMRVKQHLSVKSDGTLILCCRDWFKVYPMGNLVEEHALHAFNGQKFNEVREALVKGRNYPSLCKYCKTSPLR